MFRSDQSSGGEIATGSPLELCLLFSHFFSRYGMDSYCLQARIPLHLIQGVAQTNYLLQKAPAITPPSWAYGPTDLVTAFKQQKHTNVTVVCKDGSIKAHELILCLRSPVLKKMFNPDFKEKQTNTISFPTFSKSSVTAFLTFLYDGKDPFAEGVRTDLDSKELAEMAHTYLATELFEYCVRDIGKRTSLENFQEVRKLADEYNHQYLSDICDHYQKQDRQAPVIVDCDVGFGNTLAVCAAPQWTVTHFEWTEKGWAGSIPVGEKFKFVKLAETPSDLPYLSPTQIPQLNLQWETGDDRIVQDKSGAQNAVSSRKVTF